MNDKMFPALDVSDINGLESYRIMSDRESIHNATWQRLGGGIWRFVWNKEGTDHILIAVIVQLQMSHYVAMEKDKKGKTYAQWKEQLSLNLCKSWFISMLLPTKSGI